ncbi:MAG: hypothetical protein Q9177_001374 [Variospora cf. flavescens]
MTDAPFNCINQNRRGKYVEAKVYTDDGSASVDQEAVRRMTPAPTDSDGSKPLPTNVQVCEAISGSTF